LSRLQRFFPEDFGFTPASFLLPDEIMELEEYIRKNPTYTFIAKPSKGRGGDGIFLVKRFHELPRSALTHDFLV
jgi:glutathione synthase/RimK-type ligase-like ATP-grasp enzyme